MAGTAILFSVMALFVRMAAASVPVGMIVFTRYTVSTFFIAILWSMRVFRIRPVNKKLLLMRAVAASLGGVFYFFAVSSITLGEAVILKYTYPIFAVSFSALLYREKTSRFVLVLIFMSILGVGILMNPASFNPSFGYIWGMLNGISAGAAVAFVRKLRSTDDSPTIMFFTSFTGIIISIPFLLGGIVMPDAREATLMLLASAAGIAAQFALVYGIRFIKTGSACVVMALEVALSALLGFIVLGHTLGFMQIVGGILILTGGAVLIISENKKNK